MDFFVPDIRINGASFAPNWSWPQLTEHLLLKNMLATTHD
jgi:hypothetical protein